LKRITIRLQTDPMNANQTPNKPGLNQQLDRYFLACSALVGVATLAGSQDAQAAIQWSGLQNIPIPATNGFGGMYVDIDGMATVTPNTGGGVGAGLLPGWDINPYRGGAGGPNPGNSLKMGGNYATSTTYFVYSTSGTNKIVTPLVAGILISGTSPLIDSGASGATRMIVGTGVGGGVDWLNTTNYMGVRFQGLSGPLFGWVQIATGVTGGAPTSSNGGPGFPARVIDWAYEDSGGGITAGAVPEPGSIALGCLAAGAAGLSMWRKRKKVA